MKRSASPSAVETSVGMDEVAGGGAGETAMAAGGMALPSLKSGRTGAAASPICNGALGSPGKAVVMSAAGIAGAAEGARGCVG